MSDEKTLRDTFAAAALTGLLAQGDDGSFSEESYARAAYRWADAMLRQRDHHIPDAGKKAESTSRAVPDAWATAYAVTRACEIANHDAAPAAKASKCGGTSHDAVGTGNSLSEAEIDALQHVVEDGRIVRMQDYGCLRAMLVRLRPEWEGDDDSDRPKPINDARLAALEELSALDQELELEYGLVGNPLIKAGRRTRPTQTTPGEGSTPREGSVRDSRNANEPVAWGVMRVGGGWVSILGNAVQAETSRQSFDKMEYWAHEVVPLYRQPQPTLTDAEREAVSRAMDGYIAWMEDNVALDRPDVQADLYRLRGLLERLK